MTQTSTKSNLERAKLVILDVFELEDKPILKYRINVFDKFVILISNKDVPQTGVSKYVHKQVNERLILHELTVENKAVLGIPLTHKFHLKQFSNQYLFLNLTNKDLINLGFKEKPKTFWQKLVDFNMNGFWRWLERIGFVIVVVTGLWGLFQFLSKSCKQQESTKPQEVTINQTNPKRESVNSLYVSKTDSLTKQIN